MQNNHPILVKESVRGAVFHPQALATSRGIKDTESHLLHLLVKKKKKSDFRTQNTGIAGVMQCDLGEWER